MSINIGLVDSAIRLSALEIDWFENDGIVERIIRNNAGTLESLSIYMNKKTVSRIWKIVGCDDQIVYPQLQTVNIQAEDVSECYSLESNIDPKHVPFPKLRHLTVDSNYSYTAETFLRGSVKTVEYLDVQLTANILGILTELYSNCDQPAVRQVLLRIPNYTQYLSNGVYNDASYCTMMTKFLDALPRDLLGLRLRESTLNNICILDSVMKKFTKLHILQADGAKMRISQVCKLASLVPSLRHLYISDIKVDELFHKTEIRDIVTRLSKEYQVADSNLRYVELLGEVDSSYNINDMLTEVANCSSILMVLCPRFNQIKFEEYWQKAVYEPTSDLESELSE
ncbi:hypothetical protein IW150_005232 [Coemansia sp. RSA 2607]|nr:hypothetical protein IW150_005232 [Coemansia sp. RSA 2607]